MLWRTSAASPLPPPGALGLMQCRLVAQRTAPSARKPPSFSIPNWRRQSITGRREPVISMCKMRYCSAQLEALITDGLWIRHASHANEMATQLGNGLAGVPGVRLAHPVEVNEVFVEMPAVVMQGLLAEGFFFYPPDPDGVVRLATSFNSRETDVAALVDAARRHAAGVTTELVNGELNSDH